MILIYPENYVMPDKPPKDTMTPQLRSAIKTKMKEYITAQNRPILLKELVDLAQNRLIDNYNKHIKERELRVIALEILVEWGVPEGA